MRYQVATLALVAAIPPACTTADVREIDEFQQGLTGGTLVPNNEHPWVVRTLSNCHGVLIHPEWILTAGHCASLPSTWIAAPNESPVSQQRALDELRIHPTYDIALVKVDSPFAINEHVQTVALPSASISVGAEVSFASVLNGGQPPLSGYLNRYTGVSTGCTDATCFFDASSCLENGDSGSGMVRVVDIGGSARATVFAIARNADTDCVNLTVDAVNVFFVKEWILGEDGVNMTDDQLRGNTRMVRTGLKSGGIMRLDCHNVAGNPVSAVAPMAVQGVEIGLNCFNSTIESTCDLQGQRPDREIQGFSVTVLAPPSVTNLPFDPDFAYDDQFIVSEPPSRRYECRTELPIVLYVPII